MSAPQQPPKKPNVSWGGGMHVALVATTSALVLVLEILAGRLLAPYVGVSLDTFTGIIGTILAGIALGAAVGGRLADTHDPVRLIARSLFFGGALTWLSIPIVTMLGPNVGNGPVAIVMLTAAAFFLPAAVLSGIGPMVTKLALGSLDHTGSVVGRLSAAGTFGALVGTFGTGFVLIALLPVRTIIIVVGALLVVAGLVMSVTTRQARPDAPEIAGVIFAAIAATTMTSPCHYTTNYYCVRIVADDPAEPNARPNGVNLLIDDQRHAHVDLDDPRYLDIRYMRLFANAVETLPSGPLRVLHIGGGGFTMPRYLSAVRPGSTHVVLELDEQLVDIARAELGLAESDGLDIRTGDARLHLDDLASDSFDLIVGDAFGGRSVPWHLTTREVVSEIDRLLTPTGLYVMNVLDGGDSNFARAQLATLAETFDHLTAIIPADGVPARPINQVLLAAHKPAEPLQIDAAEGTTLTGQQLTAFIGDDAMVLTDNFAPVDQLLP